MNRSEEKVCVITGGNAGIGKETAKELAKQGMRVILACRDMGRCNEAATEIVNSIKDRVAKVECMKLDLGDLDSVRQFAQEYNSKKLPLHILINNAGIYSTTFKKTKDGFESNLGVNHFGHFLLTNLLLPTIQKTSEKSSQNARIVILSSRAHWRASLDVNNLNLEESFSAWRAYPNSKLANLLFAYELNRRIHDEENNQKYKNVTVNAVHPGLVATTIFDNFFPSTLGKLFTNSYFTKWFCKTPEEGAQTTIYVATSTEVENVSGKYFADCKPTETSAESHDRELASKLWTISEQVVRK